MTVINTNIIKEISQGENILDSNLSPEEVIQLQVDVKNWDPASTLAEGSVTEVGETYRAINGDKVAVLEVAKAVSGAINEAEVFALNKTKLDAQLNKLDAADTNSGVAVLGGVVYERKFEGVVGSQQFSTAASVGPYVNDSHDTIVAGKQGYGQNFNVTILTNTNTIRFDKYAGPVQKGDTVATETVFYISSSVAATFDQIDGQDVKPGFYVNTDTTNPLALGQGIFASNLNNGSNLQAVGDVSNASTESARKGINVIDDITLLPEQNGIQNVAGMLEDLVQPSDTNDFWQKRPALTEPLTAGGSTNLGAFWNDESALFSDSTTAKYWSVISSGLSQDVTDSNTTLFQEFTPAESTETLIYRS